METPLDVQTLKKKVKLLKNSKLPLHRKLGEAMELKIKMLEAKIKQTTTQE